MSKCRVLLVVNPKSGNIDKKPISNKIFEYVKRFGGEMKEVGTTGDEDALKVIDSIDIFKPTRILIVGGDGTVNMVANAIVNNPVPVGIIPSGSANGLASNLKLPETLDKQIEVALGEHFLEIDQIEVNGKICLHIADLGVNAELIEQFESSQIRGKLGYALSSIPTLIKSDSPFSFKIELNNKIVERTGILLAIANAKQYGTGAVINPNGQIDDGKFEVLVFKSLDILEILKTLYDSADLDSGFVECFSTTYTHIECSNPVSFQVDGELIDKVNRVEAKILKDKLQVAIS